MESNPSPKIFCGFTIAMSMPVLSSPFGRVPRVGLAAAIAVGSLYVEGAVQAG